MKIFLAAALCVFSAPAFAANYCPEQDLPYYVAEIPHGYAIVRVAYSDFCRRDPMIDDPAFVCNGDPEYKLTFKLDGKTLKVSNYNGILTEAVKCDVDFSEILGDK